MRAHLVPPALLLLALVLPAPATATRPGLPLPSAVEIALVPDAVPELGRPLVVTATVTASVDVDLVDAAFVASPGLLGPESVPRPCAGAAGRLARGTARRFRLEIPMPRPVSGEVLFRLRFRTPREALFALARSRHGDVHPSLLESLKSDLARLADESSPTATLAFAVTAEEGRIVGGEDRPYETWFPAPWKGCKLALARPRALPPAETTLARSRRRAALLERLGRHEAARVERRRLRDLEHARAFESLRGGSGADAALDGLLASLAESADDGAARAEVENMRAILALRAGRPDEALRRWRQALRTAGNQPNARYYHVNLAQVAAHEGQADMARRHFEAALTLNPGFTLARRGLGALR